MLSTDLAASILVVLPAFAIIPVRAATEALWLQPSTKWYGIDGNWSGLGLVVGERGQPLDVTVSTALSEIWVIENGGCPNNPLCTSARGSVFDPKASSSWTPLGVWQLGLEYLGLGGNGDYAMETVVVHDSLKDWTTTFQKQIVAAINDTAYYTGFLGVGMTPGRFGSQVAQSPLAALVEKVGAVPSHSYGYTAGASYIGPKGTPLSLTLGGYDKLRFDPHTTVFNLNATTSVPDTLIRGITAAVSTAEKKPAHWSSTAMLLSSWNESIVATLDTSTPFLWLPTPICDRFAAALNLTWNPDFDLYTFPDNAIYENLQADSGISFTFSLSSSDNRDNFGQPMNVPGVVNITISAKAFAQTLRYPFMNRFDYGDPAVPYFPLRRVNQSNRVIIGRAFMQEAYMIMNYEEASFSLHEARFPDNPVSNISIATIEPSPNSPYPPAAPSKESSKTDSSPSKPAIIGAVVGVTLVVGLVVVFFWLRKRKQKKAKCLAMIHDMKDKDSTMEDEPPRTPVRRIMSVFASGRSRRSRIDDAQPREMPGTRSNPIEVSADQHHERYELPVAQEPVEMDATETTSVMDTTDFGTDDTSHMSPYEIARRRMEQQLQGPVPEYTPSQSPVEASSQGKTDISAEGHYRPSDHLHPSPASSPTTDRHTNPLPSPITPRGEWSDPMVAFANALPSPAAFVPQSPLPFTRNPSDPGMSYYTPPSDTFSSPQSFSRNPSDPGVSHYSPPFASTFDPSSVSRSDTSHSSLHSQRGYLEPPAPRYQRTPIDPSRVVCLGPLPDNVRLSHHPSIPKLVGPDGRSIPIPMPLPTIPSACESRRDSTTDTLGSNFTIEEEGRYEEMTRQMELERATYEAMEFSQAQATPPPVQTPPGSYRTPLNSPCIDGPELIHIPQPAARRYSWEE